MFLIAFRNFVKLMKNRFNLFIYFRIHDNMNGTLEVKNYLKKLAFGPIFSYFKHY